MLKGKKNKIKVVDLFCGCGGMSWGLQKSGFEIIAGIDNWAPALETFKLNHKKAKTVNADIDKMDVKSFMKDLGLSKGELDCIIGGPPCQGFSKNVPATYRFLEDPRNLLFKDFLRFVEIMEPKVVVMENVAEIYNAFGGQVREEIINTLNNFGYSVDVKVLHAPDYGVPQRRRRCLFFASKTGIKPKFPPPTHGKEERQNLEGAIEKYNTAWSAISDLPKLKDGEGETPSLYNGPPQNDLQKKLRGNSKKLYDHVSMKLAPKQFARISSLKPGQALKDLPEKLRPKSGYSGAYGRLDFEMVAPTITRWVFHIGSGRFGHPREARLLTMREAARLQSFSDDFIFYGTNTEKAHQIGNAVPPIIMEVMADEIKRCFLTS